MSHFTHILFICFIIVFSAEALRGRIESCPGCSLNRLPEVKSFIYHDVPEYDDIEFKKIQGAVPELVLFDQSENEIERLPLKHLNRAECNSLLIEKGFKKKAPSNNEL